MRWIRNFGASLILMGVIGACLKQPELSVIPKISIQSASFVKGSTSTTSDTIIMVLNFADGDGDLGLNQDETAIYLSSTDSIDVNSTPFYFVYDSTQPTPSTFYVTHNNSLTTADFVKDQLPGGHYVDFASVRKHKTTQAFDTLPALACKSWEIRQATQVAPIVSKDTLYIQNNPNGNNIFAAIYYTPNLSQPFKLFDFNAYFNQTFSSDCVENFSNGRFPVLSSNLGSNSPLQGTLTWKFQSDGLYAIFHGTTIKLTIYITDRALHKSNVVTSNDIVIN